MHVQAEAQRTDIHADRFNLTGDGSVDKYGHLADKHKTGGWRAAPLIFGTLVLDIVHHINFKNKIFCQSSVLEVFHVLTSVEDGQEMDHESYTNKLL